MCDEALNPEEIYAEYEEKMMYFHDLTRRHRRLSQEDNDVVNNFLGKGPRSIEAYSTKPYYGNVMAWTVKYFTTLPGWEPASFFGYMYKEPVFLDIPIDYTKRESCLVNGTTLVKKGGTPLAITVVASRGFIQIETGEEHHDVIKQVIKDMADFLKEHNFYKGKRLTLDEGLSFLNAGRRDWDSVILDSVMKKEIRLQTSGFLRNHTRLEKFGVTPYRGIILAGDPGTGKTMVCKAIMTEADGITCVTTSAYNMFRKEYISDLFSIAQDLSPSIVFIEDLDSIGQERNYYYRGTPLLIALLAEMDGIEEKTAIVTVATSNSFETLDKALSERPSRFDRVFRLTRPNNEQRSELVKQISRQVPVSEDVREYIEKMTDGFTPPQIKEILYSMVISHIDTEEEPFRFDRSDVDSAIGWINTRKNGVIGFNGVAIGYTTVNSTYNRRKE